MTPYDEEIAQGIASGELCPKPLAHGDPCGRKVDGDFELGLCKWHSEEALGLAHAEDLLIVGLKRPCVDCGKRDFAFKATKLCSTCQRRRYRRLQEVSIGVIVGDI